MVGEVELDLGGRSLAGTFCDWLFVFTLWKCGVSLRAFESQPKSLAILHSRISVLLPAQHFI